ncbi:MAG TPA: hypothetical protein VD927_11390 [Chryseosolibacter sp.]|nr:hypothetical protein [Chryseosolibacter sp.]
MRFFALLAFFCPLLAAGQSNFAPLNEDYYHWIDRYEIKTGRVRSEIFTAIKPYKRADIVSFMDSVKLKDVLETEVDDFNYQYLLNDSWEWAAEGQGDSRRPILKHFYRKKSDFFSYHSDDFDLHINPVIYFQAGNDSERDDRLFMNTRGVEVRGMVDKKVGFYTYLTDNQVILPSYVWQVVGETDVIPHEGFWKEYQEGKGADFLQARGYITADVSKHINVQLGHDRFFIGNGYRSLAFSDYAPPSMFLKGNVKVWKVNYLFLVNQMTTPPDDAITNKFGGLKSISKGYPNKYNALHHISINIGKKLNIGVFESVIYSADDTLGYDHLRLDYFNPIIFYRAIEQQNGSSDNVLLGMDFKWNMVRNFQVYGQFLLDEFVISNIRAQNGWWANKFGVQIGGKYVDAFAVQNLDLQGEVNIVRPYTYSHNSTYGNYSNYKQAIAHPLGANFQEFVGILRYQPLKRLNVKGKLIYAQTGRDAAGENWGGNILKNNRDIEQTYGNKVAQGVDNKIFFGTFTASWQLFHNFFIEGNVVLRRSESDLKIYDNNTAISSLALRWNIPQRLYEF